MTTLDQARARFANALDRLESVVGKIEKNPAAIAPIGDGDPRDDQIATLQEELHTLREEHDALLDVTEQVADRLDNLIGNVEEVLGETPTA